VTILQRLNTELASASLGLALYVTPVPGYPDHHTLTVARSAVIEVTLGDDALEALIRAMTILDNPYQPKRP
jgi:hypothetical protein